MGTAYYIERIEREFKEAAAAITTAKTLVKADRTARFGESQQTEDEAVRLLSRRIENLLLAVVTKGQAVRAMKLNERMQFCKTLGVSLAFFEHARIIWAARIRTG